MSSQDFDPRDENPGDDDPREHEVVRSLLAEAATASMPAAVFAHIRQAISEQVQLRHEDADVAGDLDADLEALLATMLAGDADPKPDGVELPDGIELPDADDLDEADDCRRH